MKLAINIRLDSRSNCVSPHPSYQVVDDVVGVKFYCPHSLAGAWQRITPLLRDLHWLRVPKRIRFRLCVFWRCLNGTAPSYLADSICLGSWRRGPPSPALVSHSNSNCLPPVRRSTLGDRSFSVAAPRAWNSLPPAIRAASSLTNENISLSLKFSGPLVTNSLFPLNVITAILYVWPWRFLIVENYIFQYCKTYFCLSIAAFPAVSSPEILCCISYLAFLVDPVQRCI